MKKESKTCLFFKLIENFNGSLGITLHFSRMLFFICVSEHLAIISIIIWLKAARSFNDDNVQWTQAPSLSISRESPGRSIYFQIKWIFKIYFWLELFFAFFCFIFSQIHFDSLMFDWVFSDYFSPTLRFLRAIVISWFCMGEIARENDEYSKI